MVCPEHVRFVTVPTCFPVVQLACGAIHTFLRYENGTLAACGNNNHGQLGLGDSLRRYHFTNLN